MRVCVVGGGLSGIAAARAASRYCEVTLFDSSNSYPLPKYFWPRIISGDFKYEPKKLGFEFVGMKVISVDKDGTVRTEAYSKRFDRVVLCLGTELRCKKYRERKEGIVYLETADSFKKLSEMCSLKDRVAVCGSGPMALETIKALSQRKKDTIFFTCGSPSGGILPEKLDSYLSDKISSFIQLVNSTPSRFIGENSVEGVISDGIVYRCDLAAILPDSYPTLNPLTGRKEYLKVDITMHHVEKVLAAGSCSIMKIGNLYINFPFYDASIATGTVAGLNSSGMNLRYTFSGRYLLSLFNFKVVASGIRVEMANAAGYRVKNLMHKCEDCIFEIVYDSGMRLLGFFFVGRSAEETALNFLSSSVNSKITVLIGSELAQHMLCNELSVSEVLMQLL